MFFSHRRKLYQYVQLFSWYTLPAHDYVQLDALITQQQK
jgi:hypothetical protein